ncbi:hypothetical protein FGG08_003495 [Glutinoglossum americanum]|uniref:PLD phosphodiesterase domain-containing protein n=1 Tax=Glutinoglossum americanum TaxID=1670608 RepID=A0A9P8I733_9PEZI|nr:hypothetical protein FGG08_003495 [Glutinoglossum americanum]
MMWLEQLATAGSTTECRVRSLKRRARRLKLSENSPGDRDLESGGRGRGSLRIRYYTPRPDTPDPAAEPLKSHLKLTIVDDEIAVLGSGNMDRASWYTSRELGIALFGKEAVERIKSVVGEGMEGRMRDG